MPRAKETITIRLDADVLDWFRQQGSGYQTRINAILRSYVRAHETGGMEGSSVGQLANLIGTYFSLTDDELRGIPDG